jgi:hypothetical protein
LNRVEYQRGELTEWYVNGPAGFEQGFTLASAPGKSNGQPLTIALAVSGHLRRTVQKDGHELKLEGIGGNDLRYTGLSAYDATGKELRAWLEWSGSQLRLKVEDGQAQYPVVIDPWMQLAELTASDGQGGDGFGEATIQGNTIVVGALLATVGGNNQQGAAYVFIKPKTGWTNATQVAKLTASDGQAFDRFGVSIGTNGEAVMVGAMGANNSQGAAYVFVKPKGGWQTTSTFNAKLTASDGKANDFFAQTAAMSGNTVVASSIGSGYVYVKTAGRLENYDPKREACCCSGSRGHGAHSHQRRYNRSGLRYLHHAVSHLPVRETTRRLEGHVSDCKTDGFRWHCCGRFRTGTRDRRFNGSGGSAPCQHRL